MLLARGRWSRSTARVRAIENPNGGGILYKRIPEADPEPDPVPNQAPAPSRANESYTFAGAAIVVAVVGWVLQQLQNGDPIPAG